MPPIAGYILIGMIMVACTSACVRQASGGLRKALRITQVLSLGAVLLLIGSLLGPLLLTRAYAWRPIPESADLMLFEGVRYIRDVRRGPHPMIIHVVKIDLNAPGIGFLVTPSQPTRGREVPAQTTSRFLARNRVQLAINGDFFEPWRDFSQLNYYPHMGDPVDVLGFASSQGNVYSAPRANHSTVFISMDNRVTFDAWIGPVYNAISGNVIIVQDGEPHNLKSTHSYFLSPHPRTAIALDQTGQTLILFVIDGRQPNYSEGATMRELADIVIEYGGYQALNMDGGGSSALVMQSASLKPVQLNSPIHNHIPYRERPVANHLGVYANLRDQ